MRNRSFVLGIAAVTTVFGVLINIETFMSIYIQNDQGFSPTMAALCLMPGAVLSAVIAPFTGRVLDRRGPLGLSVCGFSCLVVSGILACLVVPTTPLWYSLAVFMVRAVGNACVMQNLQTWAVNCLPSELITHGTSIATTARQVGGAFINTVLFALMGARGFRHDRARRYPHRDGAFYGLRRRDGDCRRFWIGVRAWARQSSRPMRHRRCRCSRRLAAQPPRLRRRPALQWSA